MSLPKVSGNRLHEQLETWYPEVAFAIKAITGARIAGKEMASRRPATLLKISVPHWTIEIKPTVSSSPNGWRCDGSATIKMIGKSSADGRGVVCKLNGKGRLRLYRWFRDHEKTEELLSTLCRALDEVAVQPAMLITTREECCGICGRGLSDEVSKVRGIGPECWKIWDHIQIVINSPEWQAVQQDEMAELRRLMQQYHPDKVGGDVDRFIQAREQFENLRLQVRAAS